MKRHIVLFLLVSWLTHHVSAFRLKSATKAVLAAKREKEKKKSPYDHLIRIVVKEYVDSNKDGKISFDECYGLLMRLYAFLNRQAPITPPSPEKVRKLFGKQQYTTVEDFQLIAGALASRAGLRLLSYKLVSFVVAPITAIKSVNFLSDQDLPGENAVPDALQSKPLWTAVFMVTAVNQMGNLVLGAVDYFLDNFEPFRRLFGLMDEEEDPY